MHFLMVSTYLSMIGQFQLQRGVSRNIPMCVFDLRSFDCTSLYDGVQENMAWILWAENRTYYLCVSGCNLVDIKCFHIRNLGIINIDRKNSEQFRLMHFCFKIKVVYFKSSVVFLKFCSLPTRLLNALFDIIETNQFVD